MRLARPLLAALLLAAPAGLQAQKSKNKRTVLLATTTSLQDTGLLDELIPRFERKTGHLVKTLAVGSGQALALGKRGEADVLLVHAPDAEQTFVSEGHGVNRRPVMHNDFVIAGPAADPAGVRGARTAAEAFRRIARARALFLSRGDDSGTHALEKRLWRAAGAPVEGQPWYQQTGLGMGQTLGVAAEKKGYTLADRGTFLALEKPLGLSVLCEGDGALRNPYHVIEVNPGRFPSVNAAGARAFADFLVGQEAQERIRTFGTEKGGPPLFAPDAGKQDR